MNKQTHSPPFSAAKVEIEQTLPSGLSFQAVLDGRRAVYLPESARLLVTDLHWGKGETFRRHGIPIPQAVLQTDLARLSSLLDDYQPKRLIILGDLIHGPTGLTDALNQQIIDWRAEHAGEITLVAGNHDRCIERVATLWDIEVIREVLVESPFSFSHHPEARENSFNWSGHVHPTIRLSSPTDTLRLPCFYFTVTGATLPAFSEFTGGYNIQPESKDRVYALSEGQVIPIGIL